MILDSVESEVKINDSRVIEIAKQSYNVSVSKVKALDGYLDKNYLVFEERTDNKFLLKVKLDDYNQSYDRILSNLLEQYVKADFCVPQFIKFEQQSNLVQLESSDGMTHKRPVQLLTFISGKPLSSFQTPASDLQNLARKIALFMAKFTKISLDLDCDPSYGHSDRHLWHMANTKASRKSAQVIKNESLQQKLLKHISIFEKDVVRKLHLCRSGNFVVWIAVKTV